MSQLASFLGEWCAGLECEDIPPAVIKAAKNALLDTIAVAVAGRATRVGRIAEVHAAARWPAAGAAVAAIWAGGMVAPRAAAYSNAAAAHALDMDDTCFAGIVHGSAVIVPVVLAGAQAGHCSGREVLGAFVAGSEVAYRLGAAVGALAYDKGWWPTGVLAGIGAAAALAKLYGLDGAGIARAIAFAGVNSSGFRAVSGSDAKPLGVAEAASRAFAAVALAQTAASAPLDLFERAEGPLRMMVAPALPDLDRAREVGVKWRLLDPGLVVKPYPLCSCAQAAVQALINIVERENLVVDQVLRVAAVVTPMVDATLVFDRPKNENEAMFSLPYALACALADRIVTPEHINQSSLLRADLKQVMERVSYRADGSAFDTAEWPEAARVTVETAAGECFEETCLVGAGDPRAPLDPRAFEEKLRRCLAVKFPSERAAAIIERFRSLEAVCDVRALVRVLLDTCVLSEIRKADGN